MSTQIALTPAAVNKYIKSIIEGDRYMKSFTIKGEVSNLKYHSSGNLYFSIKDNEATIDCVMFSSYSKALSFKAADGMNVELICSVYLNIKTGKYSLNVRDMKDVGVGDLHKLFLELKNELQLNGFFDASHKKQLVRFPKKIAVVTSPTSAAVRDIITTIKRRYPICDVVIVPVLVQGNGAVDDICCKINNLADDNTYDCMIVGRGGGSIEDLWAFNTKEVATAVYNCNIPIISCVGHETDTTIIDFVADVRAATPTAAAELSCPNLVDMQNSVKMNVNSISKILNDKISYKKIQLDNLSNNQYLLNPLLSYNLNMDELSSKFTLTASQFNNNISRDMQILENLKFEMTNIIEHKIKENEQKIISMHNLLDSLNPLAILSRGYGICSVDDVSISSVSQVAIDDIINVKLADGSVKTKVVERSCDGK